MLNSTISDMPQFGHNPICSQFVEVKVQTTLPFSPGQVTAFGPLSRIEEQEGVKKLVLWDGEKLLLLTGCSSTLYLQENSKPRRLAKLS